MIINLSDKTKFPKDINKIYQDICKKSVPDFNELLEKAYLRNKNNIYWYFSIAASRNPLNSKLFQNYCFFILIHQIKNENIYEISKVITDSSGLYNLLMANYSKEFNIILKKKKFIRSLYSSLYKIYEINLKLFQFIVSKVTKFFFSKNILLKNLTIIDTFVFENYINRERYYNNLIDFLKPNEKKNIYFLSTLTGLTFNNTYKIYKQIRLSSKNYIIKEDFLGILDFLKMIYFIYNLRKIKINKITSKNIDLSYLINEDLSLSNYSLQHSMEGFLSYQFIKNFKKRNINIKTFINWWENQTLDKSYNYSIHKFYPNCNLYGYIGFAPRDMDFQIFPTKYETVHNIIPKKIFVIGEKYKNKIKKYNPSINVDVAPSFRFDHIFKFKKVFNNSNNKVILIGLPIIYSKAKNLLSSIPKNIDSILNNINLKIIIKPHPTQTIKAFTKEFDILKFKNCSFSEENTFDILKNVDLLISSMSSICMESVAMNIPCIVYEDVNDFQYMPIPNEINKEIWSLCTSESEIAYSIKKFLTLKNENQIYNSVLSDNIKLDYFCKTDRKNIKKFLKI